MVIPTTLLLKRLLLAFRGVLLFKLAAPYITFATPFSTQFSLGQSLYTTTQFLSYRYSLCPTHDPSPILSSLSSFMLTPFTFTVPVPFTRAYSGHFFRV